MLSDDKINEIVTALRAKAQYADILSHAANALESLLTERREVAEREMGRWNNEGNRWQQISIEMFADRRLSVRAAYNRDTCWETAAEFAITPPAPTTIEAGAEMIDKEVL